MAIHYNLKVPLESCQILLDWANPKCYSGSGTTFKNLIDTNRNNGYLKGSVTTSVDPGNKLALYTPGNGAGNNAVGDRIDIETSAANIDRFNKNNNFSFLFWVKRVGSGNKLLSTGSSGSSTTDNCIWQMYIDANSFYWWDSSEGATNNIVCSFSTTPDTTNWYLVGLTFESNGSGGNSYARGYRDGVKINTSSISYSIHNAVDRTGQTNLQWTLGGGYSGSCYTANSAGYFGMFALYNKTLSDNDVLNFYNATKSRFKI